MRGSFIFVGVECLEHAAKIDGGGNMQVTFMTLLAVEGYGLCACR